MRLVPTDLQTFEAYKKAIRAAAGQVKDNSPFCIFSDVQMPDSSKSMHTLRPFLVVGSPLQAVLPMLKNLKGAKKPIASGLCSLHEGKLSFVARSGKLDYGPIRSQAALFKNLLGKDILIPTAGGAANGKAAPAKEETIPTPFGPFAYFSTDKYAEAVELGVNGIVNNFKDAANDAKIMNWAYQEALALVKKLPPMSAIKELVGKMTSPLAAEAARHAQERYFDVNRIRNETSFIGKEFETARIGITAAVKELRAKALEEKARDLRKQAEEEAGLIEGLFKAGAFAFKVVTGEEALKLVPDVMDLLGKGLGALQAGHLVEKAEALEAEAQRLAVGAAHDHLSQAKISLANLIQRERDLLKYLTTAQALAERQRQAALTAFREGNKAQSAKVRSLLDNLEPIPGKLDEARKSAGDAIREANWASAGAAAAMSQIASGKWNLPKPDDSKRLLQKIKDEAAKIGKQAGEIKPAAEAKRDQWEKVRVDAEQAVADAHTR